LSLLVVALLLALFSTAPAAAQEDPTWERTLEASVNAVVQLRVSSTRAFDTESAGNSQGTGFVVDAERGLILTNRHMVTPGPVVAEAVFLNNEEVELTAIYRDPVHDFGIFRFDPEQVRFLELVALPLAPEAARVGVEIRVVGNDAGEKLSILSGTLARMDRNAPSYGRGNYNDFNTFYYQAASGTSGGSSGSPVLDIQGRVIALNAGGRRSAASSYYLPLDRVVRALDYIQRGEPVPRGTIQATLEHTPYHEVKRLGLQTETEAAIRAAFPDATGMLVVQDTVPEGPADGLLQSGDVLVDVDGALLTGFLAMEAALDDAVGGEVVLGVERGGERLTLTVPVQDLHAITPDAYLEMGGSVFNEVSYQLARSFIVPAKGVMVASTGYMLRSAGIPGDAIIESVDGQPTPDLLALEIALSSYPDGARVPVRFRYIEDPRTPQITALTVDRRWFPMQRCERDDATGGWPCTPSPEPSVTLAPEPARTTFSAAGPKAARALASSLVMVDFDVAYRTEGVSSANFAGAGLVVDAERGLVAVDRDTVPVHMGDVMLTFAGSVRVPAQVAYVHPVHNLAIVRYDPALIAGTPVTSARLRDEPLKPGDKVWQVGLSSNHSVVSMQTEILSIRPLLLGLPDPPQFRGFNVEVLDITESVPSVGGVLADRKGRVLATWSSYVSQHDGDRSAFFRGLPVETLQEVLAPLARGEAPGWRGFGVEWSPMSIAEARDQGLPADYAAALEAHDPDRRQVLTAARTTAGTPAAGLLRGGELLLALDGAPVTRFAEVEAAGKGASARLTVLRDGEVLELDVPTVDLAGLGVDRVISWAGLVLHPPHLEVASQRALAPQGVYIAWYWYGSPAARYGLRPTRRIIEVDGQPTPDLDTFLAIVSEKGDRESVRLKTISLDERVQVITLKQDLQYWPTREFQYEEGAWVPISH
jgi:S1-C subfamily serine protease